MGFCCNNSILSMSIVRRNIPRQVLQAGIEDRQPHTSWPHQPHTALLALGHCSSSGGWSTKP